MGIGKYQHTSVVHGNQGIKAIVLLHDQALAAIARAKEIYAEDAIQCDIELCEAAKYLLAVPQLIANTSFTKLADTIARFMNGVVSRMHQATRTPKPVKTIEEIEQSIVLLQKRWQEMEADVVRLQAEAHSQQQQGAEQASSDDTNADLKV